MSAAFGVYLGSTTASLAVCKDGKAHVIANDAGDRVTPAVVAFNDREKVVGLPAKQQKVRNASNTVCQVKQVLGRTWEDEQLQALIKESPVQIINNNGSPAYDVEFKEKSAQFSPEHVAGLIYKKLIDIAESHGESGNTHDAVLTVPTEYSQQQRQAFTTAAQQAGFTVLRVINDAAAAMLAYDVGQQDTKHECNALVYKLGGTSLDMTLFTVSNGLYREVARIHDTTVGGDLIDELLIDNFADDFKRKVKEDCKSNKRARAKLRNAAETCKHILSTVETGKSYIESLYDGIDFQCSVSRGKFESMIGGLLQQCIEPLDKLLTSANLTANDVQKVVVCGGSTKIPVLQKKLQNYFSNAEILNSIPPDEVIAVGASKQAALLSGCEKEELTFSEQEVSFPCLSEDISVKTADNKWITALPKMTPMPARRQHKFLLEPEQTTFCLRMGVTSLQAGGGEPVLLAQIVMKELPAGCQIDAVFHLRSDGSLHVTCSEPTTSVSQDVTVEMQAS